MKTFVIYALAASALAQKFLGDDEEVPEGMRKLCFTDDPTDCVYVPARSSGSQQDAATATGTGELAWRDDVKPPMLVEEEQKMVLMCNPEDPTDCVRVPSATDGKPVKKVDREGDLDWQDQADHPMVLGGNTATSSGKIDALDQKDHPMVKDSTGQGSLDWKDQKDHPMVKDKTNTGPGSLDWKDQEDHPMVKDETNTGSGSLDWKDQKDHPMVKDETNTGPGSLDWKDQEDHPMVKDETNTGTGSLDWKDQKDHPMVKDETNTGPGSLDWKDQEDHPMVKDNTGEGSLDWRDQKDHPMVKDEELDDGDEPLTIDKLWSDLFADDHASMVSASAALVAVTVLAIQI